MRVLLRFKDLTSLNRYLGEELNKLLIAKKRLEEEINKGSLVDVIEIKDNNIDIRRERITEIKDILDNINTRIESINSLLEEIKSEFNDNNFTGMVLLEFDNGMPHRVLLSQSLVLKGEVP
ncbi:hypothetical protein [Vulcanisaeta souniana]|uniref:hypothetical protein n=1 Tax=Vulcanisaeta souniana TaxID=164452 RepID=UPI00166ECBDF|nr:hypothetical protein [Vulcanisaeta souniana]